MKIVADENIPFAEQFFGDVATLVRKPGRTLCAADVHDADALIVRSVTPVDAKLLEGSRVKFVGTCTIGTDHLDLAYLAERGIGFSSAPGCNANSVVEYVLASLCALGVDWRDKRIGIVGCGNVGGHLYRRLRELGCELAVSDPFIDVRQCAHLASLDTVLGCDIVCLHTPLTTVGEHPTYHLLGREQLAQLKLGAVLINAGRGPVIDNAALLECLRQRTDLKVVLDVWEHEPSVDLELMAKVDIATPHIAGYSFDGKVIGTEMIYQALCQHFHKPPLLSRDAFMPLQQQRVTVGGEDEFARLQQAILGAYDVRVDDARMREALNHQADDQVRLAFDRLRKEYPVRREFDSFAVEMASERQAEKKPLNKWFAALGFQLPSET